MKIKVTSYPNNEFRVAVYQERFPKSLSLLCQDEAESSSPLQSELDDSSVLSTCLDSPDASPDAFNIKSKVDTPRRSPKLYLSRNGRNTILRAGSCFENTKETERLLLTGTLPGRLKEAYQALAENSTYATKTLTNWITRRSPGAKWMYTWEFQGRGALHLHLVVEVSVTVASYVKEHFQDEWNRILSAISKKSGINLYKRTQRYVHSKKVTQADVTVCDREPSRYISKYISKKATNGFGTWRFPPKTWYQVSRSLLKALREKTRTYLAEGLSYSQARGFIETASHNISQAIKGGGRYFSGLYFAWSGYGYSENFNIKEWGEKMRDIRDISMPTRTMVAWSQSYLSGNVQARCFLMSRNPLLAETLKRLASGTEDEMLELIGMTIQSASATYHYQQYKKDSTRYLSRVIQWWEKKFDVTPLCQEFATMIVNNYEKDLTP